MSEFRTHYQNLKVTRDAPIEVIKAAYRVIAQKHHPDTNESEDSQRIMTIVNEAWRVLSDPILRAEHDAWIDQQKKGNLKKQEKNIYTTENFYASEGYKTSSSGRERLIGKIGNLKNIFYFSPLLIWISILLGMFIVGSLIENTRTPKASDTPTTAQKSLKDFEDLVQEQADATPSSNEKSFVFTPIAETKSNKSAKEKFQDAPANKKQVKLEPIKLPHGYINGEPVLADDGISKFTVDNSQGDLDADVRLYKEGVQVRAFNVQSGKVFTANDISPGNYKLRYRVFLGGKFRVFEANKLFNITQSTEETHEGKTTRFSDVRVTLYKVTNGNMSVKEIDPSKF